MEHRISDTARVGRGTEIGYGSLIEDGAHIGEDCRIGHYVIIHRDVRIGDRVRVDDHAVIGKLPMRGAISVLKAEEELSPTELGDDGIVGTAAVIYRGAQIGRKVLIADMASVREHTSVGDLTIIGRGVTVENYCTVGRRCKLETECYLTAYSTVEDYAFIAPQVTTANDNFVGRTKERLKRFKGVTVKRGGRIGAGSVILPGKVIGEDALVAAGSVVTRDVPPRVIVKGSPAMIWRDVPPEQWLENQGWDLE